MQNGAVNQQFVLPMVYRHPLIFALVASLFMHMLLFLWVSNSSKVDSGPRQVAANLPLQFRLSDARLPEKTSEVFSDKEDVNQSEKKDEPAPASLLNSENSVESVAAKQETKAMTEPVISSAQSELKTPADSEYSELIVESAKEESDVAVTESAFDLPAELSETAPDSNPETLPETVPETVPETPLSEPTNNEEANELEFDDSDSVADVSSVSNAPDGNETEPAFDASQPPLLSVDYYPARFSGAPPTVVKPPLAIRKRLSGEVILRGYLDAEGSLQQLTLYQSSGHDLLDQAALEQALLWAYEPASIGHETSGVWVQIPVFFR